jgi:hypothetical protein
MVSGGILYGAAAVLVLSTVAFTYEPSRGGRLGPSSDELAVFGCVLGGAVLLPSLALLSLQSRVRSGRCIDAGICLQLVIVGLLLWAAGGWWFGNSTHSWEGIVVWTVTTPLLVLLHSFGSVALCRARVGTVRRFVHTIYLLVETASLALTPVVARRNNSRLEKR